MSVVKQGKGLVLTQADHLPGAEPPDSSVSVTAELLVFEDAPIPRLMYRVLVLKCLHALPLPCSLIPGFDMYNLCPPAVTHRN